MNKQDLARDLLATCKYLFLIAVIIGTAYVGLL